MNLGGIFYVLFAIAEGFASFIENKKVCVVYIHLIFYAIFYDYFC